VAATAHRPQGTGSRRANGPAQPGGFPVA